VSGPPSPRRPIRRLAPSTVERIAAGEVVERPASVVKELLENAVDAGATAATVRVEGGGLARIEVADDGLGIPPEELALALERHATSKLEPDGPVAGVVTLGFRGEALASIASVARVRLVSRAPGHDAAAGIEVAGASEVRRFESARALGTTVEVLDLFYNTPARRKFLRRAAAEQIEIVRTVERLYLARPSLSIRVEADGREVATYPATSRLADAAARVLGTPILRERVVLDAPLPGGRVRGELGRPAIAAASSSGLYLAVNDRPVVSRAIAQSVRAAYGDLLPRTRYPVGVLHLELAGETVDVNVHPTKREVRLADERARLDALRIAVRAALISAPPDPAAAPERGPAPGALTDRAGFRPSGPATVQSRLDGEAEAPAAAPGPAPPSAARPRWRLLGCVDALYWVAETDDGLVLFDQHAASERVLYELLLRDGALERQELIAPVPISLTGVQRETLAAEGEAIRSAGFVVEPFGPETIVVRAVPSYRGRSPKPEALLGLLDELARGGRPASVEGLAQRRAATLACHAAIRAGDVVSPDEVLEVLEALYALPGAQSSCPHGRPIALAFPRSRLDRWFLRAGA
jgi:DNA mismatch repair protein MutL